MTNTLKALALSASSLVATISFSQAQTAVSINFEGDNTSVLAAGDIAGVIPSANFNNITGQNATVSGLLDSTGATTGIGLTFTGQGTWDANKEGNLDQFVDSGGTNNHTMMSGYLDLFQNNTPAVQLTGYSPGSLHDVYVYSLTAVDSRGGTFDVNGSTAQLVTNHVSTAFVNNVNYLFFPAVAADGFGNININNDSSLTSPTLYREAINGVQVLSVPEPATVATILGGAAMLVGLRRRRA